MIKTRIIIVLLVLIILPGCTASTLKKAKQKGQNPLTARQIFDMISDNTMSLESYNFSGKIFFAKNGAIAAVDNTGQKDIGSWDIKDTNDLCLKFKKWYYGDIKCYLITTDNSKTNYSFFTSNGSAYYRGKVHTGDTERLGKLISNKKAASYMRTQFAEEKSDVAISQSEKDKISYQDGRQGKSTLSDKAATTSVRLLASNCPGCKLAGVDLKEASLANANLVGADLSGADLRYANLRRAKLTGADLSGARLNHANLPGADLRNCNLRNANLNGANLLLADFTGADLSNAVLTNAYTENTKGLEIK